MAKPDGISIRAFVSLFLTFTFLALAISGICLYVAPQCRVADEISWRMLGLAKDQWASIHLSSALAFLVLGLIHLLIYNWKVFTAYLKPRAKKILSMRPELLGALVVFLVVLVGAALIIPPFSLLPETQDAIQTHYREQAGIDGRDRRDGRGEGRRSRKSEIPLYDPLEVPVQKRLVPGDPDRPAVGAGGRVFAGQ